MSESPFGPAETIKRRELKLWEKLLNKTISKFGEFYVSSIPSDDVKSMPPRYMIPIGGCIMVILIGVFVGVFLPGYLSSIQQQYLAPGSMQTDLCDQVSISNSGTFLGTQQGYWAGGTDFSYSQATYVWDVDNLDLNTDQFSFVMNQVNEILVYEGQYFQTQNLGVNLLYWMSFTLVSSLSQAQRFYLTGNPAIVFAREVTVGSVSSFAGDCNATASSSFDAANGKLRLRYPYEEYMNNENCSAALSPTVFGYTPIANPGTLELDVDIRALITAYAVNYGILSVDVLQVIEASQAPFEFEGEWYNATSYTNPNYPAMTPIFCVNYEGTDYCVIIVGSNVGLPIYNHMGSDSEYPMPCNCTALTDEELADKYNQCNLFSLISGLIVFNNMSSDPVFKLAIKYVATELDVLAYYPSWIGSVWGKNSPYYDSFFNTPEIREEVYDFCYMEGYGYCSLIIFSSLDMYNINWAISDYYFSVANGACRDTVSTSAQNWQMLIDTPYAPLTQGYSECRNSPTEVLLSQAGIAVGNVNLLSPFGVLFVLLCIGAYQRLTGRAIPKTYSRAEKDSAIDSLAVALLRARDERRKQKINPDHEIVRNMITQIVDDLAEIAQAGEETYYKEDDVDKFEVNWGAVVRSPFNNDRAKNRSESSVNVELTTMESGHAPGGKTVFVRKPIQNMFPDLLILNQPSPGCVSKALTAPRLSDIRASEDDRMTTSAVRSTLLALKQDTNSDDLYTSTIAALDELISSFKNKFRALQHKGPAPASVANLNLTVNPEHRSLGDRASALNNIEALTRFQEIVTLNEADRDVDDEEEEDSSCTTSTPHLKKLMAGIYKKIYALMLLHAGIVLACDNMNDVQGAHGDKIAYFVNSEVCTLTELRAKSDL